MNFINTNSIPHVLQKTPHWAVWNPGTNGDGAKRLFQPGGQPARKDNRSTWSDFKQVIWRFKRGGFAGIAYFFDDGEIQFWEGQPGDPVGDPGEAIASEDEMTAPGSAPTPDPTPPTIESPQETEPPKPLPAPAKRERPERSAPPRQPGRAMVVSSIEILDRLPPQNLEAERSVLGCLLIDSSRCDEVLAIISAEDFYAEANRKIFRSIVAIHDSGIRADTVLLVNRLKETGEYEAIGGAEYLKDVLNSVAIAANAAYYAGIVREKAMRRWITHAATNLLRDAYDGKRSVASLLEEMSGMAESRAERSSRFQCHSMAELAAMDLTVDYIFEKALIVGAPGIIGGREKTLKTQISLDCAISMATATPWLGHFPCVRAARCVYFAGEGGLVFIRESAKRIADSKGFRLEDIPGMFVCDEVPALTDESEMHAISLILRDFEAEFAFFDPLYLMMASDFASASNVYAMGAMLRRMLKACKDAGATPIICHHFRKTTETWDAPDLSDLSQAGCAEFAGQWLLLNRQSPYDEESPGEHDLIVRLGSRLGFSSKWAIHVSEGDPEFGRFWQPTLSTAAEAREKTKASKDSAKEAARKEKAEKAFEDARKAIVEVAVKMGKPCCQSDIRSRVHVSKTLVSAAWFSLVDDKSLIQAGYEVRGRCKVEVFLPNTSMGQD